MLSSPSLFPLLARIAHVSSQSPLTAGTLTMLSPPANWSPVSMPNASGGWPGHRRRSRAVTRLVVGRTSLANYPSFLRFVTAQICQGSRFFLTWPPASISNQLGVVSCHS